MWIATGTQVRQMVYDGFGNLIWDQVAGWDGGLDQLASTAPNEGAALIGWPSGFGITQPQTNQFFSGNGSAIQRFNDRVFVAGATVNDGAFPNVTKDWLSTFQSGYGVPPAVVSGVACVLTSNNASSAQAIVGGAQSLNFTAASGSAIGVSGYAINNNASYKDYSFGFYAESHRMNDVTGGAYGMEIDVTNFGLITPMDAYGQQSGTANSLVIALQLSGGASLPTTGQVSPSAAMVVSNNPVAFDKGIVFVNGSLSGANKEAIVMPSGYGMSWYASSGVMTSRLYCSGTTTAGGSLLNFNEGSVIFYNTNFSPAVQLMTPANAVNYFSLIPASTGNPIQITARGSDTNIDIELTTKGTGAVWIGAYTVTAPTATGYITVKDSTGTVRKLLCA